MFLFREAGWGDEDAILELARHLNTLNLPPERAVIRDLLGRSVASFDGRSEFDPGRRFLFVLEDPAGRVLGTSMIHAQHGTFDEPHVFFRVMPEERYARLNGGGSLIEARHVHMVHTTLHLQLTYAGPTELGGLVLHPDARKHPQRLGRLLSLARFVFIAGHRGWMRDRLLAELLPPLYRGPDGVTRSPLWDALGYRFTGLDYHAADRLSRSDKEFIWLLFPRLPIHASLLPEGVQEIIGKVGPTAMGAFRMLQDVGFKYDGHVDPFDGGPHLEANTDDVTLVRDTLAYVPDPEQPGASALPALVGAKRPNAPHFTAVFIPVEPSPNGTFDHDAGGASRLRIGRAALVRLGLMQPGEVGPPADARVFVALRPKRRRADHREVGEPTSNPTTTDPNL